MTFSRRLSPLYRFLCKSSHAREVVGRLRGQKQLLDSVAAETYELQNAPDHLVPAKQLLDTFALALADDVPRPVGRASANGRIARARIVLRNMLRHAIAATLRDEPGRVVILVGTRRNRCLENSCRISEHFGRCIDFGHTLGLYHLRVDHQSMPVVREQVPHAAEYRAGVATLAEALRLTVAAPFMRLLACASVFGLSVVRFLASTFSPPARMTSASGISTAR